MTGNQVQYYATMETQRHNEATEAETNRYNQVTERLETRRLDLEEDRNRIEEEYKKADIELREQYNMWYEKWTEANEAEKRRLEAEGNQIQQMIAENEADYKKRIAGVQERLAVVESSQLDENERHNREMESINQYANNLENQMQRYRADQWEAENKLAELKINTDKQMAVMRGELEGYKINLDDERENRKIDAMIEANRIEQSKMYANLGSDLGSAVLSTATDLITLLMGGGKAKAAGNASKQFLKLFH